MISQYIARLLLALAPCLLHAAESRFPVQERDEAGFAFAIPGVELAFPRDHGSHPEFKTEWWYLTGHLDSPDQNHRYGFQLTFFRSATEPGQSGSQMYLAHAALFDKQSGTFRHEERLNSDEWNADSAVGGLDVYNGNWYLRMENPDTEAMVARFSIADLGAVTLTLTPTKPKTLFGKNGYSRKGDAPGAASHYITFTRLAVKAEATLNGQPLALEGVAWMDHEFSSSQLTESQVGWNWSSVILDDGTEIMAYVMRRANGEIDPNSSLTIIGPGGQTTALASDQFSWTPTRHWKSPRSEASYPVEYTLSWKTGDGARRLIKIEPYGDNQEIADRIGGFTYWEGACRALDESGSPIGQAYTELTGYAESLYGKF